MSYTFKIFWDNCMSFYYLNTPYRQLRLERMHAKKLVEKIKAKIKVKMYKGIK